MLIAGSYTPFCLVTLRGERRPVDVRGHLDTRHRRHLRRGVLAVPAALAVGRRVPGHGLARRLRDQAAAAALAPAGLWLLVAGGLCYTFGTIFYVLKKVRYMHAVWHVWVLAGSICHFLAVLLFVIIPSGR